MPTVTIINDCAVPLHISLRHISPIHFQNNIAPGASAVFKTGRVWFTIEARIARGGKENNEYTLVETFAAPVAVSLCALSLGAGMVWVAGAATAAGGVGAAITSIGARVGATAAASAPTARRLYKYARKGQHIVQVGEVIGIGGGALLGRKATTAQQGKAAKEKGKGTSSTFGLDENARVKEAKRVLKGLLEGSVVSSSGWYMKGQRTIRIKGGPRATMMDGLLVIETDTLEAFEVVSDDPVDEDGKAAFGDGTGEGSLKSWMSSLKKKTTGKDRSNISDSQTSFPALQVNGEVKEEEKAYQLYQRQLYEKMSESSQWIYSRIRRAPHEPEPVEETTEDSVVEKGLRIPPREGMVSPAPPPDDDPAHPPTLETILQEIGFNQEQIQRAKAAVGELPTSKDQEIERKEKIEKAMFMLFSEESKKLEGSVDSIADKGPSDKLDPTKPLPEVVGAEKVTTPHWTAKARQAVEDSAAIKILQVGGTQLFEKGEKWLQKDGKK